VNTSNTKKRASKHAKPLYKPKNRAESESRLIEVAKEVFAEHGYDKATTRMVATQADVNLGLITRYFGNKHGLLVAVVDHEAAHFNAQPLPYPPQKTLLKECEHFVESRFLSHAEHAALFRIIMVQSLVEPSFSETLRNKHQMDSQILIKQRLAPFFDSTTAGRKSLQKFVDQLGRAIISSVVTQFLMMNESKETCIKDLRELTGCLVAPLLDQTNKPV
jgi:AcrR family transcriptional regulator